MNLNKKYLTVSVYCLITAAAVILFGFICFRFSDVSDLLARLFKALKSVFWGTAVALLLNPVYSFFFNRTFAFVSRKKPHIVLQKALALTLTFLLLLLLLAALVMMIIPQVTNSILSFAAQSASHLESAQDWINAQLGSIPFLNPSNSLSGNESTAQFSYLPPKHALPSSSVELPSDSLTAAVEQSPSSSGENLHIDVIGIFRDLLERALQKLTEAVPQLISVLSAVVNEIKDFSLGLILSVYLLASKERISKIARKLTTALFGQNGHDRILSFGKLYYSAFISFLTGKFLDAVIVTCLCYIALTLLGIPSALMLSLLLGILNMIPFLGPILGAFIGSSVVLLFAPSRLFLYLIAVLVLQQLDAHLIEPHIIGARTELSNFWILISVILMGNAFGVIGMFLAVPTFTVLKKLVTGWTNRRLDAKKSSANKQA